MTLKEALETGKPIRRKDWRGWVYPQPVAMALIRWSTKDVMRDDWEVMTDDVRNPDQSADNLKTPEVKTLLRHV